MLSEKLRRLWAGSEAQAFGRGGIAAVSRATGLSRATVGSGLRELKKGEVRPAPEVRGRRRGGGRKALTEADPSVLGDLESLVEPMKLGICSECCFEGSATLVNVGRILEAKGLQVRFVGVYGENLSGRMSGNPSYPTIIT